MTLRLILHLLFIWITSSIYGQKTSNPYFLNFNEFSINMNYSLATLNKQVILPHGGGGFGGGINKVYRPENRRNPVVGIEYALTHFHRSNIANSYSSYYTDADFYYNQLRVPFSIRFHLIGKRTTFFIEPGAFVSVAIYSSVSGMEHRSLPNGLSITEESKEKILARPGMGLSTGIGIQTPLKKGFLVTRLDAYVGSGRTVMSYGNPNETSFFYNPSMRLSVNYRLATKP